MTSRGWRLRELAVKFNSQHYARDDRLLRHSDHCGGFASEHPGFYDFEEDIFSATPNESPEINDPMRDKQEKFRLRVFPDVFSTKKGYRRLNRKRLTAWANYLWKEESASFKKNIVSKSLGDSDPKDFGLNLAEWFGNNFILILNMFASFILFRKIYVDERVTNFEFEVNTQPIYSLFEIHPQIQSTCAPNV